MTVAILEWCVVRRVQSSLVCIHLSDKLHHLPVHLHLYRAGAVAADARVERVVRRHVHGWTHS